MGIISQIFALAITAGVAWATQGASLWVQGAAIFATSMVVSRIFGQKPPKPQDNGVRQQVPPATVNSLPIVYGDAYLGGTFVDAVLSENQKIMWYVLSISSISQNGQFSYDTTKMYFGDRLITFDSVDTTKVVSLTDGSGNVDTKVNGFLFITLYTSNNSGVITRQNGGYMPDVYMGPNTPGDSPGQIPVNLQWPSTNRQMYNQAFAIVKLYYSTDAGTTQLQPVTFKVSHTLNGTGVAKPGDVWYDYMTNTEYGGAVDTDLIDASTAISLNTYSDELITFTNNEGNPSTQPRYRINGVLDTGTNVLENVDKLLECCDSWMTYNSASGQWSIVVNKAQDATMAFNDTNIIGDIKTSTLDINQSVNQIEAKFPNKLNKDIPGYVLITTPSGLLYPNEPVNKYTTEYALTNDSVQAQYLANRVLEQAREDLIVTITTTYYGIQANAGDVVSITDAVYGWSAKLFRVLKVQEAALPDGTLGATLDLSEYNAQVYDDKDITEFEPAPNSELSSSDYFSSLSAPTISDQQQNAAVPSFSVNCVIPTIGRVTNVYLYYTTTSTPSTSDWTLLGSQSASNSQPFVNGSYVKFTHVSLPTNTYYFAYKVGNEQSQSILSSISSSFYWLPNPSTSAVAGTFIATWSPSTIQVPYNGTVADFTGIAPQLYGTTSGGSVDFIAAQTDSDVLFVNNSWRIGGSSTTGYGDIVKTNITIGSPSDAGNYALFPAPTAQAANNATLEVPVRYKDSTGVVYQGATAILQFTYAVQGDTGAAGSQHATAVLYQWSTVTPSNPNGTSTYTWATGANSSYTGTNGWETSISANPGIPLIQLYTATKGISASSTDVTTSVNWASGFSVQAVSQNGQNGANGLQAATPTIYQWAATIPTGPSGTSTYTWSSASFTPVPSGWSATSGSSPSAGYTLWAAKVNLVDSATVSTSTINWTTASISAVGYAGTNGATGTTGASARICYTKTSLSSLNSTPSTITTSGSSSYPPNDSWGTGTIWQATPPSITAGESVYQSDGIYSPSTGNTVWNVPYLSALKVGSLSAISANLGTITAGSITGVTITGSTVQTAASGQRVVMNTSTNALNVYNSAGTLVSVLGGNYGGGIWVNGTATGGPACQAYGVNIPAVYGQTTTTSGLYNQSYAVYGYSNTTYNESIYGYATFRGDSNHAVRGVNANGVNTGVNTAGFIGGANGYDFYADGAGTNYGPFTGAHDVLVPIGTTIPVGYIVCDVQCIERKNISNTVFEVAQSTQANQVALGVVCVNNGLLANFQPSAFIEKAESVTKNGITSTVNVMTDVYNQVKDTYDLYSANAVGEGQVYVCGESGDIQAGDLIVTSSIAGVGMKQSDDIVKNITVAKARESVTFSSPNESKMIACIYLCG